MLQQQSNAASDVGKTWPRNGWAGIAQRTLIVFGFLVTALLARSFLLQVVWSPPSNRSGTMQSEAAGSLTISKELTSPHQLTPPSLDTIANCQPQLSPPYESLHHRPGRKYALVIVGSMSHMKSVVPVEVYDGDKTTYTPLRITAKSILKHVVAPNGGGAEFDIYIHSWNPDLRQEFYKEFAGIKPIGSVTGANSKASGERDLLAGQQLGGSGGRLFPALVWSEFENNTAYERLFSPLLAGTEKDWHQVSYATSISRAAMAVLQHQDKFPGRHVESTQDSRVENLRDSHASSIAPRKRIHHSSTVGKPGTEVEEGNGSLRYERVMFVRPDILLTKDIVFTGERYRCTNLIE